MSLVGRSRVLSRVAYKPPTQFSLSTNLAVSRPIARSYGTSHFSPSRASTVSCRCQINRVSRAGLGAGMTASTLLLRQQQRNASWWTFWSSEGKPDKSSAMPGETVAPTSPAHAGSAVSAPNTTTETAEHTATVIPPNTQRPISEDTAAEIEKLSREFRAMDPDFQNAGMLQDYQDELLNVPEKLGFLRTLGLDFGWGPSSMVQWMIEHTYVMTGLGWTATFAIMGVLSRVVFLKFTMDSMETTQKLKELTETPVYHELTADFQKARLTNDTALAQRRQQELSTLKEMHGIRFTPMLLNFLSVPISFGFFRVIRSMAEIPVPSMETGGILWFTNLAVPDPYYVLPFLSTLGIVGLLKTTPTAGTSSSQTALVRKFMMWGLIPITLVVTVRFCAALQFFFFVTGMTAIGLNMLRFWPRFRRALGYPAELPHMRKSRMASPGSGITIPGSSIPATMSPDKAQSFIEPGMNGATYTPPPPPAPPVDESAVAQVARKLGMGSTVDSFNKQLSDFKTGLEAKKEVQQTQQRIAKSQSYEARRQAEEEDARQRRLEARRLRRPQGRNTSA